MTKDGRRKYTFNLEAFDEITTEEQAYWLGFLTADGSVGPNYLRLEIQIGDLKHLEKLRNFMKSDVLITFHKNNRYCRINFNSKPFIEKLAKYGLVQNKVQKTFTPNIPEELKRHFYRGVMDGDGWLTTNSKKVNKKQWQYGFSGWKDFIYEIQEWFSQQLNRKIGTFAERYCKQYNCTGYQVIFCGNLIFKDMTQILYKDTTIYLDRKYEKMKSALNYINKGEL